MTRKTPTVSVSLAGPPAVPPPVVIADVTAPGTEWSLRITRADGLYGALLVGPEFGDGIEVRLWPSLLAVLETVGGHMRRRGLDQIWLALMRAMEKRS